MRLQKSYDVIFFLKAHFKMSDMSQQIHRAIIPYVSQEEFVHSILEKKNSLGNAAEDNHNDFFLSLPIELFQYMIVFQSTNAQAALSCTSIYCRDNVLKVTSIFNAASLKHFKAGQILLKDLLHQVHDSQTITWPHVQISQKTVNKELLSFSNLTSVEENHSPLFSNVYRSAKELFENAVARSQHHLALEDASDLTNEEDRLITSRLAVLELIYSSEEQRLFVIYKATISGAPTQEENKRPFCLLPFYLNTRQKFLRIEKYEDEFFNLFTSESKIKDLKKSIIDLGEDLRSFEEEIAHGQTTFNHKCQPLFIQIDSIAQSAAKMFMHGAHPGHSLIYLSTQHRSEMDQDNTEHSEVSPIEYHRIPQITNLRRMRNVPLSRRLIKSFHILKKEEVVIHPPSRFSKPLNHILHINWPAAAKIPLAIQHFLQFLACSNEGEGLLVSAASVEQPQMLPYAKKLQYHLSAIVEKLRNPSEGSPITLQHLRKLLDLFARHQLPKSELKGAEATYSLFYDLCKIFKVENILKKFDPTTSQLNQAVFLPPLLPMPLRLSEAHEPSKEQEAALNAFFEGAQHPLNQLLKALAASKATNSLLEKEMPFLNPSPSGHPIISRMISLQKKLSHANQLQLRNHLAGIINKLRSPEEHGSLMPEHLLTLTQLTGKIENSTPTGWLLFLCMTLNGTINEFEMLHEALIHAKPLSQASLFPKTEISIPMTKMSLLGINSKHLQQLAVLQQGLLCITNSNDWDEALNKRDNPEDVIKEGSDSSNDLLKAFLAIVRNSTKALLRKIIHQLQLQPPSTPLEDLHLLLSLYKTLSIKSMKLQEIPSMLMFFGYLLHVDKQIVWKTITAYTWEEVKKKVFVPLEVLPPASDHIISLSLTDHWHASYFNSVLQLIARLDCFDEMLTHKIAFIPPSRELHEDEMMFFNRCESIKQSFDQKIALQSHLRAVIGIMRSGKDTITHHMLETLFQLVQINGWHFEPTEKQDPVAFFRFLRTALGRIESQAIKEFSIRSPLPGHQLPKFDTMEKLIENSPHGLGHDDSIKQSLRLTDPAPQTIFIQQQLLPADTLEDHLPSISHPPPFSPAITLPVYDANNPDAPPIPCLYQLKVVIGTQSYGSYSTFALQKYQHPDWLEAKDTWFCYGPQITLYPFSETSLPDVLAIDFQERGYYLAYVRHST